MKNLIIPLCLLILPLPVHTTSNVGSNNPNTITEDSLCIWCCPDLYELANTWISSYASMNPGLLTNLQIIQPGMIGNTISGSGNIGLITKDYLPLSSGISNWKMSVGRDILVTVINAENPFLNDIYTNGISVEKFNAAYAGEADPTWGTLLGDQHVNIPVNSYCLGVENMQSCLTGFMGSDQITKYVDDISKRDELIGKIQHDKYALGFCRLANVLDYDNQLIDERVKLVPIDVNGNNRVDYFENIYCDVSEFTRGVWIGKYPKELYRNIYSISGLQPTRRHDLAFLEWVLTDGQQDLHPIGYSELLSNEVYRKVQSLYPAEIPVVEENNAPRHLATVLFLLVIGFFGVGTVTLIVTRQIKKQRQETVTAPAEMNAALAVDVLVAPGGVFFDKTHTWAFMEKDGFVRIGIDDFLLHITGRITKIKMKAKDERIQKGKSFISIIQDGKQLDLNSPVSGTVTACNEKLVYNSSLLNRSPFADGWVYTVKPDNWIRDIRSFLTAEKYRIWLNAEFLRLKDFLVSTLQPDLLNTSRVVYAGGW